MNDRKKLKSNSIRSPDFGKRVKAVRKHLKLNQKELAEKLNIAFTTLSGVETGKTYPCYEFFYNMVEHFNVNLYYLLFGKGEMFDLPGKDVPAKTSDPFKKEMLLLLDRPDISEFFHYFLGSKIVRYHLVSEFYDFILKKGKEIEMEMKALIVEEDSDEK